MKAIFKGQVLRLCLFALMCIVMLVPMIGPAMAFAIEDEAVSNLTIRITPPSGWATQLAEVEIRITDHAGAGFQMACIKAGNGNWQDITTDLEQTENRYYCVVNITENCTVYVRVTGNDGKTYEKSQYIQCFNTGSDQQNVGISQPTVSIPPTASSPSTPSSVSPSVVQPPAGQGTVVDNATNEDGREFFTIATQNNNTFYLVIDRQSNSENVYFLDTVKESDLLSLAEKDTEQPTQSAIPEPEPVCICTNKCAPGEVNTACPVCVLSYKDCTGKTPTTAPEPEKPAKGSSTIILVVIAALAVGGAGYYLKIWKPKHDLDDAEDFDDLTGEDEETVNEDDLEPAPHRDFHDEPEEPEYPEGYGYEEPEDEE